MSKFHSNVSRRDFMKGLGLGAAGIGAAAAAAPVFHDLDEMVSAPTSMRKRAWWVKEVDEPTVEIDWNLMARHHSFHSTQSGAIIARYLGLEEYTQLLAMQAPAKSQAIKSNTPGFTVRDQALSSASVGLAFGAKATDKFVDSRLGGLYAAYFGAVTPEELGVPKWQGTPEENLRMLKAAMVFFGASDIGVSEMDEHHKKLVANFGRQSIAQSFFPYQSSPTWPPTTAFIQPMVFANQPNFSFDAQTGTTTIPSNGIYSISYTIPQSHEMFRTTPNSRFFSAANIARYRLRENTRCCTQAFIRGLGYQCMYDEPYGAMPGVASATLTGLVENSRHTIMGISPEHGSTVGLFEMLTDLPLEHTKPIDAGIFRFCKSCGVCAKACPSNSIEPKGGREISWEPYPSSVTPKHPPLPGLGWDPHAPGESEYYKLGRKTYWTDGISCAQYRAPLPAGCQLCFGVCTFNSQYEAMIHDVVRGTVATTGVFNGFFANMTETFGYGLKEGEEKEDWWNMSLPSYGYSTSVGSRHGGY